MATLEKKFEFDSDCGPLKSFRDELGRMMRESAFDEKAIGEFLLAVQEAITNVIRHAYAGTKGRVEITVQDCADRMTLWIQDFGRCFDITRVPDPVLPKEKPGGLGIYLIKKMVDEIQYDDCKGRGNRLCLVKYKKRP